MNPHRRAGARLLFPLAVVMLSGALIVTSRAQDPELLTSSADPVRLAAAVHALEQGLDYVPGELLVRFREGTGSTQRLSALSSIQFSSALDQRRWLGDTLLVTPLPSAVFIRCPTTLFIPSNGIWSRSTCPLLGTLTSQQGRA